MQVSCPACARLLTLPDQLPGALVQCPFCATVMDVSGHLAARGYASSPQPMPTSQGLSGTAAVQAAPQTVDAAPAASRGAFRPSRKRRDFRVLMFCVFLLAAIAVMLGGAYVATHAPRGQVTVANDEPRGKAPSSVVYRRAEALAAEHAPAEATFRPEGLNVRKEDKHRWTVSAFVDVPLSPGKVMRQPWRAGLYESGHEQFDLEWLEIGRDTVYSRPIDELPDADQEYQTSIRAPVRQAGAGSTPDMWRLAQANDYYRDQTPEWAMKQVAYEIRQALAGHKLLVVWVFDSTASARGLVGQVADRFSAELADLGGKPNAAAASSDDPPLLMAALAFGKEVQPLQDKPSADVSDVEAAVQKMTQDASGSEQTFAAIDAALEKYLSFRTEMGRQMLIVAVTDEAGDDESQLEATLAALRKQAVPVSVIGGRAPFGKKYLPFVDAEAATAQGRSRLAAVTHLGPETPAPEHIDLAFITSLRMAEDAELLDSGFGPFALTRLCNESGGAFYACRFDLTQRDAGSTAGGYLHFFDPKVMRRYVPDYVSQQEYEQLLQENKARQALHAAAALPRVDAMRYVKLDFLKTNEVELKRLLDQAQKSAATIEPGLEALYQVLKPGEADRPKLKGARWQASFDLAMGRVLAARVRTEGYNVMLAQLKGASAFKDASNNTFLLEPSDTISAGSVYEKLIVQSKTYLQRVVKEHPGTPWAFFAERELEIPLGWKWTETRR